MLFKDPISNESRSGNDAAISSYLVSGFILSSEGGNIANGAGSNLGSSTSILNFNDSSVG